LCCARLLRSGISTLVPAHLHTSPPEMGNLGVGFRLRANCSSQVSVTTRTAFYNAMFAIAITRLVESVRLVIPQHCSTRAELVIIHTMTSRLTVIRSRLSAWICQPFCCQRTLNPIPSECLTFREACLVGLTESLGAISPSSSAFWFPAKVARK